jgi:hypothetical protein
MPTYHIVCVDWAHERMSVNVRAKSLMAAIQLVATSSVKHIVSADIVEARTPATRMRKWDARDSAEELRARDGWRREGVENERNAGRHLDRAMPKLDPILTPRDCTRFLQGMLIRPKTPNGADSARR